MKRLKFNGLILTTILACLPAFAGNREVHKITEIGPHFPLFIAEKNVNPENQLVVYAKADSQCHLQRLKVDSGSQKIESYFDFYWLMNRQDYKKTNSLLKKGYRDFLQVTAITPTSFEVLIPEHNKLESDLKEARFHIETAKNSDGTCDGIKVTFKLGPSDSNAVIQVESVYAEVKPTWNPLSPDLISATIKGIDIKTGQVISRKYMARKK